MTQLLRWVRVSRQDAIPPAARASAGAVATLMIAAACHQAPALAPMRTPPVGMGGLPIPMIAVQMPEIRHPTPDMRLDLSWLERDEFIPPGATHVGPTTRIAAKLLPRDVTRFPSMELCTSPDKSCVLFHDGMKRQKKDMYHWLMLLKNEAPFPNAVFGTRTSFEASWSQDSRHFAVTHFVGDNSSEVFVTDVTNLARTGIEVKRFLEEYFPSHLALLPMFLKAYRWTADNQLIVRAIARSRVEPYELYGCEVLVGFAGAENAPETKYLRGYVLGQTEAAL